MLRIPPPWCLQVHSWKQTAEEKTAALEVLTEHADYTADTLKRTQTQLEHLQKVHSEEMDHLRTSLERYEKKNEYLTGELEELSRRYEGCMQFCHGLGIHCTAQRFGVGPRCQNSTDFCSHPKGALDGCTLGSPRTFAANRCRCFGQRDPFLFT